MSPAEQEAMKVMKDALEAHREEAATLIEAYETCNKERAKLWAMLREAHQFLNAQASTREEIEEFMGRLNQHFGLRGDF